HLLVTTILLLCLVLRRFRMSLAGNARVHRRSPVGLALDRYGKSPYHYAKIVPAIDALVFARHWPLRRTACLPVARRDRNSPTTGRPRLFSERGRPTLFDSRRADPKPEAKTWHGSSRSRWL